MDDQHGDDPVGPDTERAYRGIILAAAAIAKECAMALAGENVLIPERSTAIEGYFLQMAEACRIGGAQLAETDFVRAAEVLRLRRTGPDPSG